jgi:hypothetical protein
MQGPRNEDEELVPGSWLWDSRRRTGEAKEMVVSEI